MAKDRGIKVSELFSLDQKPFEFTEKEVPFEEGDEYDCYNGKQDVCGHHEYKGADKRNNARNDACK